MTNYVDLLFLANMSLLIFEEGPTGYYIHGRNQMQHADTDLAGLNGSLLQEEEGLVSDRGLITGYSDEKLKENQTFFLYLTQVCILI